jgi:ABC-type dipeptide/oligopeptide/nickel transport system permease subunit
MSSGIVVDTDAIMHAPLVAAPRRGAHAAEVLRRLATNPSSCIGLIFLLLLVLVALLAPELSPHDPVAQDYSAVLHGPSGSHPFGTDDLGRDVLSRVIYGTRISLRVGFIPVSAAFLFGTVIGLIAGFFGGWLDAIVMRLTDIGLAFPGILLALVVVAVLGPGLSNVMVALGIADVPLAIRVARGGALAAREQPFVASAVAIGARDRAILARYIFPTVLASVLVVATLEVANAILIASGLSFLGLGAQPPAAEWGSMLASGQSQLQTAWWAAVFPGAAIVLAVLAINLVGDGLRDALDPKTRR